MMSRGKVHTSFSEELLSSFSDCSFKRKGSHVAKTLMWQQLYLPHSNKNTSSMLSQLSFLTSLTTALKDSPEGVVTALGEVREKLTHPHNLRMFMAAEMSALPQTNPLEEWKTFLPQTRSATPRSDGWWVCPHSVMVIITSSHSFDVEVGIVPMS